MKIALTGSNGLLGSALISQLRDSGHQVAAISRSGDPVWTPHIMGERLAGFDALIHSAANTNVELCETAVDECYRDNWTLTESLAQACSFAGVRMVFLSSTGVYGKGLNRPYCEYDSAAPTTHHHRSKLLGETSVLRQSVDNLVIRTGWLFGGAPTNPKNFIANRIKEARSSNGKDLLSNNSQFGNPTYSIDVAQAIDRLLNAGHAGVFNCVNEGAASRYEYVREIIGLTFPGVTVKPVDGSQFNRVADVSANECARNWRMELFGLPPMRNWRDALKAYIVENSLPESD